MRLKATNILIQDTKLLKVYLISEKLFCGRGMRIFLYGTNAKRYKAKGLNLLRNGFVFDIRKYLKLNESCQKRDGLP